MKPKPGVLLVEDDASVAGSLKKGLAAEGYEVVIASRGDDGLAQARDQAFAVVITDFKLPGLSGLELVGQLHAAKPKLSIIMMTAFDTPKTAIEAAQLGACGYLLKPFEMAQLLELVAKAVAGHQSSSSTKPEVQ